jgi:hypothetical protein
VQAHTLAQAEEAQAQAQEPSSRPSWAWRPEPLALAGGHQPRLSLCFLLGGARGGAWQLLQFLDRWDAAQLRLVCQELRDAAVGYGAQRRRSVGGRARVWIWPMGKLQGQVTTVAGDDDAGSTNRAGPAARFSTPWGLAVRPDGSLLLADYCSHTIRCISGPERAVSTLAGAPGQSGSADGLGAAARFSRPAGVALHPDGSLLVADSWSSTIRRVSAEGIVSTVAGCAGRRGSTDGPALQARFCCPSGLALDAEGSLYIADASNHTIRCLSPGTGHEGT